MATPMMRLFLEFHTTSYHLKRDERKGNRTEMEIELKWNQK